MNQIEYIGFRAERSHRLALNRLAARTGQTRSSVLRALIENAALEPITTLRPIVRDFQRDGSAGNVLADTDASK